MSAILKIGQNTKIIKPRKKFSIFNPAITFEHREFYEKITGRLQGIFPICSQGESAAVEVSENETEQQQVSDLMKRIEKFSSELIHLTKELFNQFYQAKEDLYTAILSTTAFNKINLIDRNLLERTCDVRWWAMETAFSDCISHVSTVPELFNKIQAHLLDLIENSLGVADLETQKVIQIKGTILTQLIDNKKILTDKNEFILFCDTVKELQSKLDESNLDHPFSKELTLFITDSIGGLHEKVAFACDRLEDINNSYTLYRDLVITDMEGNIIANSNQKNRPHVLGINVSDEEWFIKALKTESGSDYCSQDVAKSKVEEQASLVYSTAIRENSNDNGKVIGVMGVFFDFQSETNLILNEYLPRDEQGEILEGCYSLFTNECGEIIASSDEIILEIGSYAHIPRNHRNLEKGEKYASYAVFEGTESAILSAKTDGYLEYEGLGWSSHMIIPKVDVFKSNSSSINKLEIGNNLLKESCLVPEINRQTFLKVQDDKESIQLISLNGIVFASKLGKRGAALGPIFKQVTKTATFATNKIEELLYEMAEGVLDLHLKSLENFSKQAIDLIDRNLFERSADICWWATDQYFWNALKNPSPENALAATKRLQVINSSYTMYRNLVLIDNNGEFVACSRNELKNELKQRNYSDRNWFQETIRLSDSSCYHVEDVEKSSLESKKEVSLIYTGGVRSKGLRKGEVVGVLAILFDWDQEAVSILKSCLPHSHK
ncbi:MAG: hypothetical protein ACI86H_003044, partial [bacterium]